MASPYRIAGNFFGFNPDDSAENSQSVLTQYFPELKLGYGLKNSRGGRLGRAPEQVAQQVTFTGSPTATAETNKMQPKVGTNIASPEQPTTPMQPPTTPTQPNIPKAPTVPNVPVVPTPERPNPFTPAPAPERNYTPDNPNPQSAEEAVKYLYQTQLGRKPEEGETKSWLNTSELADKSLTEDEWASLKASFQASPEYASIKR